VEVAADVPVDVSELPRLRDLAAYWSQVSATIAAGTSLRRVALDAYGADDLTPLAGLRDLSSISLKDRPKLRSLAGLGELVLLETLGVFGAARLEDVSELDGREMLTRLELEACRKVASLDDLAGCTGLRVLNIAEIGDLPSAAPLAGLSDLVELYAYGSTKFVDGDLSPIAGLPRLEELRMQSRRHYKPSVPDLKAALAARAG